MLFKMFGNHHLSFSSVLVFPAVQIAGFSCRRGIKLAMFIRRGFPVQGEAHEEKPAA